MVFCPKALFLATCFTKLTKNSIFLSNYYQKFSKFYQNFPTICVFRQNGEKSTHRFVNVFEKYPNKMHFSNFLKNFFGNFLKISQQFVFSSKRAKNQLGFLKFLFKIGLNNTFSAIFLGKFSKFSQMFPKELCFSSKCAKNYRRIRKHFFEKQQ